jgi:hypothetical protein
MRKELIVARHPIPIVLIAALLLAGNTWNADTMSGPYLNQEPPGPDPKVFAPGVISVGGTRERSLSLSPKGDELFFTRSTGWPNSKIMHMKKQGDQWSMPEAASFLKDGWATLAVFSPDGQILYYSTSHAKSDNRYFSLWRSKKNGDGWSEPESVIDMGGGFFMEFHPTVTRDGSVYFLYWDFPNQTGDIYFARLIDGRFTDPVAQLVRFFHVMRGQDEGGLPGFVQPEDVIPNPPPRLRVQSQRGFVHEQHLGGMHEPPRDFQPALHAAGIGFHEVFRPVGQFDQFEDLAGALPADGFFHAVHPAVKIQIFPACKLAVQGRLLENHADA